MTESISDLVQRLRAQDTDDATTEVKASAKQLSRGVWDSVSAFANTSGGTIVLGLDETSGFMPPADGFDIDRVRDQFVAGMGDAGPHGSVLTNPPQYGLRREVVDGAPVLVVTISPNLPGSRPCFVTAKGLPGGAFRRVDDKDIRLSATEVFEMRNELQASDADGAPVAEASLEDLDDEVLDGLIKRLQDARALQGANSREQQLKRMNVLDTDGRVRLAGLLAAGFYPQQFEPRLLIDVAVHPGREKAPAGTQFRFLDRAEGTGNLVDAVNDAVAAVTRNLKVRSIVDGRGRREEFEIPPEVVREAIANAVLHREYSPMFLGRAVVVDMYVDRIEITSPGGLWGGRTVESLGDGTSSARNRRLAMLMRNLATESTPGFTVEGQGSGVPLMLHEMAVRGLEPPRFIASPDQVKVVLVRPDDDVAAQRPLAAQASSDASQVEASSQRQYIDGDIARWLAGKEPQSIHEIAEWSGLSLKSVRARLRQLIADGRVHATAPPQSRHRKYFVKE